ncbi:mucin-5B-like [Rhineura floridana]|uniref:mucin-5B-like n=1 Tax=Rhineura floridana TaxID=261503 RepID=UPI002AC7F24C|nr:mucin-5B-like [Rhineura floridana]
MGFGRGLRVPLWALTLMVCSIQQKASSTEGVPGKVTIIPPLTTTPVITSFNSAHNRHICSTWGHFHFKTFDGDIYHFPGTCNYVFASHCNTAFEDFNIQIRRTVVGNTPTISSVTMRLDGIDFEMEPDTIVVNGERVQLPYSGTGFNIEKFTVYMKLTVKSGLTLMWNEKDSLMLELDEKYANQTCGLCGDFNGIPTYNEFFSNSAQITVLQFGNMQKLNGPTEDCEDPTPSSLSNCTDEYDVCQQVLTGPSFSECNALVGVDDYIESCVQDLCICDQADVTSCLCNTFAEYSRQCAHAGGQPQNWRTPDLCPMACSFNMQYQECGSPCTDTCTNSERSQLCEDHCVDGCFCPPGTVYDDINNAGCIPLEQCSCVYNGKSYAPGTTYSDNCRSCSCAGGQWSCTELPCPGICSVEGGSHISTYDEKRYNVHGDCTYVLSKFCEEDTFTVLGELRRCGLTETETCLKMVALNINGGQTSIVVKPNGAVFVNWLYTQLPISAANVTIFRPSSFFIVVHTNFGLQLEIQLIPIMQLYIHLDPSFKGRTCGLCGNFDSRQIDDFTAINGVVEGTAPAFANTWKIQAACPNIRQNFEDPCTLSIENEKYAHHWCGLLTDSEGPFATCHPSVNPAAHHTNCMFDTCNCERSEDCMCAALSSYVTACAAKGIQLVGWRTNVCSKYTTLCPKSLNYSYTIHSCQPTCRSLSEPDVTCNVKFVPVDGCTCESGTYMDDSGKCVPANKCPCYYKGTPVLSGEVLHDVGVLCTCSQGKLNCIGDGDSKPTCIAPMVYFDCRNATVGSIGAECQKSCQTLDMHCYNTQCVSGCVCPTGLVSDGKGGCIPKEECPCIHNDATYRPGEKIKVDCNTCVCKNRMWQCTKDRCLGTCAVYGDGHYITFDDKRYTFNGKCEYTLVQDHCGQNNSIQGTFRVITENLPCGTTGTTCSKSIKVFFGNYELILSEEHHELVQRGDGGQLPYKIRYMGMYLVIEANNGLILLWDKKTSIFIKLSADFKGQVCGLCGNYDGNGINDFTTRSQSVVGDVLEFGNSWKVSPSCPDAKCTKDPCSKNPYRKSWSQKQCSIINSKAFAACHSQVEPTKYYEACVTDSCACDTGGDCECFCTAVAAYAQACSEFGVCISWRTPSFCPMFCDYYNTEGECEWHYKPCGAPCMKTCRNPSGRCLYQLPGLEGCYPHCPADKPYFNEDEMNCVDVCGCYDAQGNYHPLGKTFDSRETCQSCECTSTGIECSYDAKACYCYYEGKTYIYKDVIYNTTDGLGWCMIATCDVNGTIHRELYKCGGTTAPPFTFTTISSTPSSVAESTTPETTACVHKICEWTEWYDVSYPKVGTSNGDYETPDNIRAKGHNVCKMPDEVECRAQNFPTEKLDSLGQNIHCSKTNGLICNNKDQIPPICYNYEIRFHCCQYIPCGTSTPISTSTSTPETTSTSPAITPIITTGKTTSRVTAGTTTTMPHLISTTPESTSTICQPKCQWTSWYSEHNPSSSPGDGDIENPDKIRGAGGNVCEHPQDIECRAVDYPELSLSLLGQNLQCNTGVGLLCKNEEQTGKFKMCYDYEVRFLCCNYKHCQTSTTPLGVTTTTTTETPSSTPGKTTPPASSTGSTPPPLASTTTQSTTVLSTTPGVTSGKPVTTTLSTPLTTILVTSPPELSTPSATTGEISTVTATSLQSTPISKPTSTIPTTGTTLQSSTVPVVTTTTLPPAVSTTPESTSTICQPNCQWTSWYSEHNPSSSPGDGDIENPDKIRGAGGNVCEHPQDIECRAVDYPELSLSLLGQNLQCNTGVGLLCKNEEQTGKFKMCYDYEVRFLCCNYKHCQTSTTPLGVTTTATTETPSSTPGKTTPPASSTGSTPPPLASTTTQSTTVLSTTPGVTSGKPVTTTLSTPLTTVLVTSPPELSTPSATTGEISTVTATSLQSIPISKPTSTIPTTGTNLQSSTVPVVTTTTLPLAVSTTPESTSTFCQPKCQWTSWYSEHNPSSSPGDGDIENPDKIRGAGGNVCEHPQDIECRAVDYPELSLSLLGQNLQCNTGVGLLCKNEEQTGKFKMCYDYEVRFLCCDYKHCQTSTTPLGVTTTATTETPSSTPGKTTPPASSTGSTPPPLVSTTTQSTTVLSTTPGVTSGKPVTTTLSTPLTTVLVTSPGELSTPSTTTGEISTATATSLHSTPISKPTSMITTTGTTLPPSTVPQSSTTTLPPLVSTTREGISTPLGPTTPATTETPGSTPGKTTPPASSTGSTPPPLVSTTTQSTTVLSTTPGVTSGKQTTTTLSTPLTTLLVTSPGELSTPSATTGEISTVTATSLQSTPISKPTSTIPTTGTTLQSSTVPVVTTTTLPPAVSTTPESTSTFCQPNCQWTSWYSEHNPSSSPGDGDIENPDKIRGAGGNVCEHPQDIECRAVDYPELSLSLLGQNLQCNTGVGLLCKNKEQTGKFKMCYDYEVRFLCCDYKHCQTSTTPLGVTTTATTETPSSTLGKTTPPASSTGSTPPPLVSTTTQSTTVLSTTPGVTSGKPVTTTLSTPLTTVLVTSPGELSTPSATTREISTVTATSLHSTPISKPTSMITTTGTTLPPSTVPQSSTTTLPPLVSTTQEGISTPLGPTTPATTETPGSTPGKTTPPASSTGSTPPPLVSTTTQSTTVLSTTPGVTSGKQTTTTLSTPLTTLLVTSPGELSTPSATTGEISTVTATSLQSTPISKPTSTIPTTGTTLQSSTVPVVTTTTLPPAVSTTEESTSTICQPNCHWTSWYSEHNPSSSPGDGDIENPDKIRGAGGNVCEHPEDIECRAVDYPELSLSLLGQNLQCNTGVGLLCKNKEQTGKFKMCYDYEVRFLCCDYKHCQTSTTPLGVTTTATTETPSSTPGKTTPPASSTGSTPPPLVSTTTQSTTVLSTTPGVTSGKPVTTTLSTPLTTVLVTSPGELSTPSATTGEISTVTATSLQSTPISKPTSTIPTTGTTLQSSTVPVVTTTTLPPAVSTTPESTSTFCQPNCHWTSWYSEHNPSSSPGDGDIENPDKIRGAGGNVCEHPEDIECRAVDYPELSLSLLGQNLQCNTGVGLLCKNKEQTGKFKMCYDYEVRFLCCDYKHCQTSTTPLGITTTATTETPSSTPGKTTPPASSTGSTPPPLASTTTQSTTVLSTTPGVTSGKPVTTTLSTPLTTVLVTSPGELSTPSATTGEISTVTATSLHSTPISKPTSMITTTGTTLPPSTVPQSSTTTLPPLVSTTREGISTPLGPTTPATTETPGSTPGNTTPPSSSTGSTPPPLVSTTTQSTTVLSTTPGVTSGKQTTTTLSTPHTTLLVTSPGKLSTPSATTGEISTVTATSLQSTPISKPTSTIPTTGTTLQSSTVPVVTTTTLPPAVSTTPESTSTICQPNCQWTSWYSEHNPSSSPGDGDIENPDKIRGAGGNVCEHPQDIECRAVDYPELSLSLLGQNLQCNTGVGLLCKNKEQTGKFKMCYDYEVRFLCCDYKHCQTSTTPLGVTTTATTETPSSTPGKTSPPASSTGSTPPPLVSTTTQSTTVLSTTPGVTSGKPVTTTLSTPLTTVLVTSPGELSTPSATTGEISTVTATSLHSTPISKPTSMITTTGTTLPPSTVPQSSTTTLPPLVSTTREGISTPLGPTTPATTETPGSTPGNTTPPASSTGSTPPPLVSTTTQSTTVLSTTPGVTSGKQTTTILSTPLTTLLVTSPGELSTPSATTGEISTVTSTSLQSTPFSKPTSTIPTTGTTLQSSTVPVVTATTLPPAVSTTPESTSTICQPKCQWTSWYSEHNPSSSPGDGDIENPDKIRGAGGNVCEHPEDIECRAVDYPELSLSLLGQNLQCNTGVGLLCKNKEQTGKFKMCYDYEVRFLCCDYKHCQTSTTPLGVTTTATTETPSSTPGKTTPPASSTGSTPPPLVSTTTQSTTVLSTTPGVTSGKPVTTTLSTPLTTVLVTSPGELSTPSATTGEISTVTATSLHSTPISKPTSMITTTGTTLPPSTVPQSSTTTLPPLVSTTREGISTPLGPTTPATTETPGSTPGNTTPPSSSTGSTPPPLVSTTTQSTTVLSTTPGVTSGKQTTTTLSTPHTTLLVTSPGKLSTPSATTGEISTVTATSLQSTPISKPTSTIPTTGTTLQSSTVPVVTTTTLPPAVSTTPESTSTFCQPNCHWTSWYSEHNPSSSPGDGDIENPDKIRGAGGNVCEHPQDIECRAVDYPELSLSLLGQNLQCNTGVGLLCKNKEQTGKFKMCYDYEVRFLCCDYKHCQTSTTPLGITTTATTETPSSTPGKTTPPASSTGSTPPPLASTTTQSTTVLSTTPGVTSGKPVTTTLSTPLTTVLVTSPGELSTPSATTGEISTVTATSLHSTPISKPTSMITTTGTTLPPSTVPQSSTTTLPPLVSTTREGISTPLGPTTPATTETPGSTPGNTTPPSSSTGSTPPPLVSTTTQSTTVLSTTPGVTSGKQTTTTLSTPHTTLLVTSPGKLSTPSATTGEISTVTATSLQSTPISKPTSTIPTTGTTLQSSTVPVVTTTTLPPAVSTTPESTSTFCQPNCHWTSWYSEHNPSSSPGDGDIENPDKIRGAGGNVCEHPQDIECRAVDYPELSLSLLGQNLQCNTGVGLLCKNKEQTGKFKMCYDYEVRFLCCDYKHCQTSTTPLGITTTATTETPSSTPGKTTPPASSTGSTPPPLASTTTQSTTVLSTTPGVTSGKPVTTTLSTPLTTVLVTSPGELSTPSATTGEISTVTATSLHSTPISKPTSMITTTGTTLPPSTVPQSSTTTLPPLVSTTREGISTPLGPTTPATTETPGSTPGNTTPPASSTGSTPPPLVSTTTQSTTVLSTTPGVTSGKQTTTTLSTPHTTLLVTSPGKLSTPSATTGEISTVTATSLQSTPISKPTSTIPTTGTTLQSSTVPVVTTTTLSPAVSTTPESTSTICQPNCQWTSWYSEHNPSSSPGDGDIENPDKIRGAGGNVCEHPQDIECRAVDYPELSLSLLGQNLQCNTGVGLLCKNKEQTGKFKMCYDYEVRFLCCDYKHCQTSTTPLGVTTTATTETPSSTPGKTSPPASSTGSTPPPLVSTTTQSTTVLSTTPGVTSGKPVTTTLSTPLTTVLVTSPGELSTPSATTGEISTVTATSLHSTPISKPTSMITTTGTTLPPSTVPQSSTTTLPPLVSTTREGISTPLGPTTPATTETPGSTPGNTTPPASSTGSTPPPLVSTTTQSTTVLSTTPGVTSGKQTTTILSTPLTTLLVTSPGELSTPSATTGEISTVTSTSLQSTPFSKPTSTIPTTGTTLQSSTVPVVTATTLPPAVSTTPESTSTICQPKCQWTSWYSEHNPSSSPGDGDIENPDKIRGAGGNVCEHPEDIECRAVDYPELSLSLLGQNLQCNTGVGLLCKNKEQTGKFKMCYDYEVRFLCCDYKHCQTSTTPLGVTTTATTETPSSTPGKTTPPASSTGSKPPPLVSTTTQSTTVLSTTPGVTSELSTPSATTREISTVTATSLHSTPISKPTEHNPSSTSSTSIGSTIGSPTVPLSRTTPCFCHVSGATGGLFSPGEVIYNRTDSSGCSFYALCNKNCEIERFQEPCPSTTSHPSTPSVTTAGTSLSPSVSKPTVIVPSTALYTTTAIPTHQIIIPTPVPGCPDIDPPRKTNETWMLNNCTMATCEGNNKIVVVPEIPVEKPECVSGLPPIKIVDKDGCTERYECECICTGWDNSNYETFGGTYYTFQDNCTYILVKEILNKHGNFSVLVDNYFCDADNNQSCSRSIIVNYNSMEVVLSSQMHEGVRINKVLFNNEPVSGGFTKDGISVTSAGTVMTVEIAAIHAFISFNGLTFLVQLPFSLFQHNTEGQCGICSNDRSDDCRLPNGHNASSCSEMASYWKVYDKNKPYCHGVTPTEPPPQPPTPCTTPSPLCELIVSDLFADCHKVLPPREFYEACLLEACRNSNDSLTCYNVEMYASLCTAKGICTDWRSRTQGKCPYHCPKDKVYDACGPIHPATCDNGQTQDTSEHVAEGCFCPKDKILFNSYTDICVEECGCVGPDGLPKLPGTKWKSNCQECICDPLSVSVQCKPQACETSGTPKCEKEGFVAVPVLTLEDPCCPEMQCKCNTSACPNQNKTCEPGYKSVLFEGDCCVKCERVPDICVVNGTVYRPGMPVPSKPCETCICGSEQDPATQRNLVECKPVTCDTECPMGYEYQVEAGECCGKCVQVACIISINHTTEILKPGEIWQPEGNKCRQYECEQNNNTFISVHLKRKCPIFDPTECESNETELTPDGCCETCKPKTNVCNVHKNQTLIRQNECISSEIVELTYCEGACPSSSVYSNEAKAMQHKCTCCQELKSHRRKVTLTCQDGKSINYDYIYVDECQCMTACIPEVTV